MSGSSTTSRTQTAAARGASAAAERGATAAAARPWQRWAIDLAAVAVMVACAVIGFAPSFAGPAFLLAGFGALVLGLAIALAGAYWRLSALMVAAATVVTYAVLGGALAAPETTIAGFIPTLDTLITLFGGVVFAWKDFLTTLAPLGTGGGFLIVPFASVLVVTVLAGSLALRARRAAWALVPLVVLFAFVVAFGMTRVAVPVLQGVLFAATAVGWLAYRRALEIRADSIAAGSQGTAQTWRRAATGAAVLAVAMTLGAVGSAVAAPDGNRYVLRDAIEPPLDLRHYPSPLQSWRGLIRDHKEDVLLTVDGLPEGARVRLATLDSYDGSVYNVGRDGAGRSASFSRLGDGIAPTEEGTAATVTVTLGKLQGVWLPDAGYLTAVRYAGDRAEELRRTTFYNRSTGVGVVTAGLRSGDTYTFDTIIPETPTTAVLQEAGAAKLRMSDLKDVPEATAAFAGELATGAATAYDQAAALSKALSEQGFFSHGLEGEAYSRSGHGADRVQQLITSEQWVGDDEQYAVTMALAAAQLGLPARVVMGFYPEEPTSGTLELTGDDLHAWVEIAFQDAGWVVFDPTPPEDQLPTDRQTVPQKKLQPQSLQPPPPVQENVETPPDVPEDEGEDKEDEADFGSLFAILGIVAAGVGVIAALLAPFIVILLLKLRRRARRRSRDASADRISGAWEEVVDTARDLGTPMPVGRTRQQTAGALATAFASVEGEQPLGTHVVAVAERADAQVFGPGDPSDDEVAAVWTDADTIVDGMRGSVGPWRRLRSRVSLRSFGAPGRDSGRARVRRSKTADVDASLAEGVTNDE